MVMLKHKLYIILFLSIFSFSCAKIDGEGAKKGAINLSLTERDENLIVKSTPRQYKLTILNTKGEIVYSAADNNTTGDIWLFEGQYTLKAQSGTEKDAEFDAPYYYGEKAFEVVADKKVSVEVETMLKSIKFTVVFGAELDKFFSAYSTTVSNTVPSGTPKKLTFSTKDAKSGYFKENPQSSTFNWNAEFVAFGGQPFILQGTINNTKANDHYIITFKLEEGSYESGGARVVAVVANDNTLSQDDTDLNLGIKRYPEAVGEGFDIDQVKNVSKTDTDQSLIINFAGFPELKNVEVSYDCPPLSALDTEGAYRTFDLIGALNTPTVLADLREDMKLDIEYTTVENCRNAVKFDLTRLVESTITPAVGAQPPYTFTFKITDVSGSYVYKTLSFNVINSDIETLQPKRWDIWATKASISGRWKKDKPSSMSFRVWPANGGADVSFTQQVVVNNTNKTFSLNVTNLSPSTTYYVQAVAEFPGKSDQGNIVTIKTEDNPQLINSSFDRWMKGAKESWFPRANDAEAFWDSGNLGANTLSSVNPTEPEYNDVKDGDAAAKMTSRYVVIKFAAGNLYSGRFKALNGTTPDMEFGQKFTARPSKLKGWYKYNSVPINKEGDKKGLSGKPDRFHIWMMVTTAKNMPRPHNGNGSPFDLAAIAKNGSDKNVSALCFGEFHNEKIDASGNDITTALNMSAYESFSFDLKYFTENQSLEPQYIVVVMSASKYGDFFTGGEGAQLLIDKLELVYE